jgi:hypothetical protein
MGLAAKFRHPFICQTAAPRAQVLVRHACFCSSSLSKQSSPAGQLRVAHDEGRPGGQPGTHQGAEEQVRRDTPVRASHHEPHQGVRGRPRPFSKDQGALSGENSKARESGEHADRWIVILQASCEHSY